MDKENPDKDPNPDLNVKKSDPEPEKKPEPNSCNSQLLFSYDIKNKQIKA